MGKDAEKMKYVMRGIVIIFALVLTFPIAWMISGSFKSAKESQAIPPTLLPPNPTLYNYDLIFEFYPILRWTFNSLLVCVVVTVNTVLINTAAAYGFEKKKWRWKEIVFWPFLISMMLPGQITLIPAYLLIRAMGLYDNLLALIVPSMVSAFMIFFYRQYLKTFPDEILYVAEIDGAGEIRKYFQILLPLTKPALATMAILTFMGSWQNFLWPLILLPSEENKTLIVGIAEIVAAESQMAAVKHARMGIVNYGLISAGATIAFVPMLIIFAICNRHFIKSLYSGGLK